MCYRPSSGRARHAALLKFPVSGRGTLRFQRGCKIKKARIALPEMEGFADV